MSYCILQHRRLGQTRLERVVGGFDNFGCCWVSKGTKNLLFSSKLRGRFMGLFEGGSLGIEVVVLGCPFLHQMCINC